MSILVRLARASALTMVLVSLFSACEPVPTKVLSLAQKEADMKWMFSQFDENYAPLEYKMRIHGFDYESLKREYLLRALLTKNNTEFYLVVQSFVAQFKDAHTTVSFNHGGLPNRAQLAYLGISGRRKGDVFVVTEILPTFDKNKSSFPIRVGDEISHMNGKPLAEIIQTDLNRFSNLGQSESNTTYLMNRLFNRLSTTQPLPQQENAVLTLVRRDYTEAEKKIIQDKEDRLIPEWEKKIVHEEVTVPWNIKDVFDFRRGFADAKVSEIASSSTPGASSSPLKDTPSSNFSPLDLFQISDSEGKMAALLGLRGFDGALKLPSTEWEKLIPGRTGYNFLKSFYVPDLVESWVSDVKLDEKGAIIKADTTPLSLLKKVRYIPAEAEFITAPDATFPAYITEEKIPNSSETKLVGTLFLHSFSPGGAEADVIKEFKDTLNRLQFYRVQDLVIDLINNGGGSLSLGLQLAQALSNTKVEMPDMQMALSDTWLREFERMSLDAPSDAERTLAKRVYRQLDNELDQSTDDVNFPNRGLSSPISTEILVPFELKGNSQLKKNFNTVILVNEMCASMCDIFSAILQDNDLAKVMGSQTMGAGGNVVSHYSAPNSHFVIRQTESLIVRTGGRRTERGYLENNGVRPDYPIPVNEHSDRKYRGVRQAAVDQLLTPNASVLLPPLE